MNPLDPLRALGASAWQAAEEWVNEERLHLAVTGLSRAGKTVFITSLVENLLALAGGRDTLPKFRAALEHHGDSRLRGVTLLPAGAGRLPRFDHAAHVAALAGEQAAWPARTEDVAELSLAIVLDRRSAIGRSLGPRRVRIDLLDYPGEWLLDLPLLDLSFATWSHQTLARLRQPPRAALCADFLGWLATQNPEAPADEGALRRGHDRYRAALEACRDQLGLRYLQPGRFLNPGPQAAVPFMWFFPAEFTGRPIPGSNAALLEARFDAYKRHMRDNFFNTHFRAFDRQVLLVDVLGALHAGRAAFEDTAAAIADLCRGLRGAPGWFGLRTTPIARVAVVATKADHVPALRRDNLRHLLAALAGPAQGTATSLHVAAAVHATRDARARLGGRDVEVVEGVLLGEAQARPYFVGDVPAGMPPESFWSGAYFALPVFRPPRIAASRGMGVPHIGLDEILVALLGDRL
ncbi:MAG: YcjX family protein [Acetobacteraceae bacterium]|nr:YcjX family protein [Acetobacteraceae bacterium]